MMLLLHNGTGENTPAGDSIRTNVPFTIIPFLRKKSNGHFGRIFRNVSLYFFCFQWAKMKISAFAACIFRHFLIA